MLSLMESPPSTTAVRSSQYSQNWMCSGCRRLSASNVGMVFILSFPIKNHPREEVAITKLEEWGAIIGFRYSNSNITIPIIHPMRLILQLIQHQKYPTYR